MVAPASRSRPPAANPTSSRPPLPSTLHPGRPSPQTLPTPLASPSSWTSTAPVIRLASTALRCPTNRRLKSDGLRNQSLGLFFGFHHSDLLRPSSLVLRISGAPAGGVQAPANVQEAQKTTSLNDRLI